MLTITTFCLAFYANFIHVDEPVWQVCVSLPEPIAYDVNSCPGEVTSPGNDDSTATCEITLDE